MKKLKVTAILAGAALLGCTILTLMSLGINDAGYRTVIQYPTGTVKVKFEPGMYPKFFGKTTVYNDVITADFDRDTNPSGSTIDQEGIPVRYRDGGTGSIYGKARFALPQDEDTMKKLHREFRSNKGVAFKLIKSVSEEAINQTAGLMTSEEGYDAKRAIFTQWARQQITAGLFQTEAEWITETDEATGKTINKQISVIKMDKGAPLHYASDLKKYGISLVGFQLNNPDFEPKTLKQIADKRQATMAIITAKAKAEEAKQAAITAEEQGKANVMIARYEKEVEKERAVVDAQRLAQVALIKAERRVAVASQAKLEAEQKKLEAAEYKEQQILIGEGDAERKRLTMEADGALEQKLNAWVQVNAKYAEAVAKNKWVPDVMIGGAEGVQGGAAQDLLNLLLTKTAKDIALEYKP